MGLNTMFSYLVGLTLLFILGIIFVFPIKKIFQLIGNGIMGGLTLILFNLIGGIFGLQIIINPLNALIVGLLGVPGVVIILIMEKIL